MGFQAIGAEPILSDVDRCFGLYFYFLLAVASHQYLGIVGEGSDFEVGKASVEIGGKGNEKDRAQNGALGNT